MSSIKAFICCTILSVSLTGCGFTPLYSENYRTLHQLHDVKIALIKNRTGQYLRNKLLALLQPHKANSLPLYRLEIELNETSRQYGLRKDNTPQRNKLTLVALYTLYSTTTNKAVFSGSSEVDDSFSVGLSSDATHYSFVTSEKYSREKILEHIAQNIQIQVANYIHNSPVQG